MLGLMMKTPLLLSSILTHAARTFPDVEIVSRTPDHPDHRTNYAGLLKRSSQLANALTALGVKRGDRVATLAWNGIRHLELYYGISGIGAVCHTVNPRLFVEQIIYIINHAEDRFVFFDSTFVDLVDQLQAEVPVGRGVDLPRRCEGGGDRRHPRPARLRRPDAGPVRILRLAAVRREHRGGPLLHVGHDGQPEGRAVQPPQRLPAFARRGDSGLVQHLAGRQRRVHLADVPRDVVGHAVLRGGDGLEARHARPEGRRREPAQAVRAGRRHLCQRCADGVARLRAIPAGDRRQADHAQPRADGRHRLPALADGDAGGRLRRAGAASVGHDGDLAGRDRQQAADQVPQRAEGEASRSPHQAGPRHLRRRARDPRRRRQGSAARRQGVRRPDDPRSLDRERLLQDAGERARRTAGSSPATSPPSTRMASCRSPTAPRT